MIQILLTFEVLMNKDDRHRKKAVNRNYLLQTNSISATQNLHTKQ